MGQHEVTSLNLFFNDRTLTAYRTARRPHVPRKACVLANLPSVSGVHWPHTGTTLWNSRCPGAPGDLMRVITTGDTAHLDRSLAFEPFDDRAFGTSIPL